MHTYTPFSPTTALTYRRAMNRIPITIRNLFPVPKIALYYEVQEEGLQLSNSGRDQELFKRQYSETEAEAVRRP